MSVWEKAEHLVPWFVSKEGLKYDKRAPSESQQANVLPHSVKDKTPGSSSVGEVFLFACLFLNKIIKHCPT